MYRGSMKFKKEKKRGSGERLLEDPYCGRIWVKLRGRIIYGLSQNMNLQQSFYVMQVKKGVGGRFSIFLFLLSATMKSHSRSF